MNILGVLVHNAILCSRKAGPIYTLARSIWVPYLTMPSPALMIIFSFKKDFLGEKSKWLFSISLINSEGKYFVFAIWICKRLLLRKPTVASWNQLVSIPVRFKAILEKKFLCGTRVSIFKQIPVFFPYTSKAWYSLKRLLCPFKTFMPFQKETAAQTPNCSFGLVTKRLTFYFSIKIGELTPKNLNFCRFWRNVSTNYVFLFYVIQNKN